MQKLLIGLFILSSTSIFAQQIDENGLGDDIIVCEIPNENCSVVNQEENTNIENVFFNTEEQTITVQGKYFNNFLAFTEFTDKKCYEDARLKVTLDETPQISALNVKVKRPNEPIHEYYLDRKNMQVDFPLSAVVNGRLALGYISYQLDSHIEVSSKNCQESYRLNLDMAMQSNKHRIWNLEMTLLGR